MAKSKKFRRIQAVNAININGAINLDQLEPVVRYDDSINADSIIELLKQLEKRHMAAAYIYVICDNARYYRSKAVKAYLESSRIKLFFLPPYAPNLNLIERLWKFFKRKVLHNRYFESFGEFASACKEFFANPSQYKENCVLCWQKILLLLASYRKRKIGIRLVYHWS